MRTNSLSPCKLDTVACADDLQGLRVVRLRAFEILRKYEVGRKLTAHFEIWPFLSGLFGAT